MNGHELARQIRAQQLFDKTLLIAQTGWGRDDRERPRAADFDCHLVKPIDHEPLRRMIDGEEQSHVIIEHPAKAAYTISKPL